MKGWDVLFILRTVTKLKALELKKIFSFHLKLRYPNNFQDRKIDQRNSICFSLGNKIQHKDGSLCSAKVGEKM